MITKTAGLMLMLALMTGFAVKRYNRGIAGINSSDNSLAPKTGSPEIFKVSRDTIHVNIEGKLSMGLLINNKYYAFYEVRDPMSTQAIRKFYIIEKNGKTKKEVKVPGGILQDTYPKLCFWHGRIIVNTEFYKSTYYLDEDKGEFVRAPEIITIPLFEDGNYLVTSVCKGEWGSTIYFKYKLAGTTYSTGSGCPLIVNKSGDKYFINTSDMLDNDIIEISDPTTSTATTVFKSNNLDSRFYIPTSFVAGGVLYHIYNSYHDEYGFDKKEKVIITKDSVKIGVINKGEFKPVYKFKDKFNIQFQQQLSPDYQICTFHTEERIQVGFKKDIPPYREAKYGFIEIMDNQIKIHYFISKKGRI